MKYKNNQIKKVLINSLTNNKELIDDMYDCIDINFVPIQITVFKDKSEDTGYYIALFNNCGGGTQAKTINKLLDNCKEVLSLVNDVKKNKESK